MFPDFKNELTGKTFDDKLTFRNQVVKILRELYPDLNIRVENDGSPEIIYINDMQCGLSNLLSRHDFTAKTSHELKQIIQDHFGGVISAIGQFAENLDKTWEEARSLVFPQLMPRDYAEKFGIVSRTFGREILVGIVLDDERSYRYVRAEELEKWGVSKSELYEVAAGNLAEKSSGMAITLIPPPRGFLAVATGDGFDAVRIILPSFQELVKEHIGTPFRFGVPNRDFLICWNAEEPEDFQTAVRENIANDSKSRPYPLSSTAFEIDENGEIKQLQN